MGEPALAAVASWNVRDRSLSHWCAPRWHRCPFRSIPILMPSTAARGNRAHVRHATRERRESAPAKILCVARCAGETAFAAAELSILDGRCPKSSSCGAREMPRASQRQMASPCFGSPKASAIEQQGCKECKVVAGVRARAEDVYGKMGARILRWSRVSRSQERSKSSRCQVGGLR
jgi:hypothetical protein